MIISILVDQQPHKIGHHERDCVQDSLANAVDLIVQDLQIQNERNGKCTFWVAVGHIFNKKKSYYRALPKSGAWAGSHGQSGLPEVRLQMIRRFKQKGGFVALTEYIQKRQKTMVIPEVFYPINYLLVGTADALQRAYSTNAEGTDELEEDAIRIGRAVMEWLSQWTDEEFKRISIEHLENMQQGLHQLFDKLVHTRRDATYEFYAYWRSLCLKLIPRPSLPLGSGIVSRHLLTRTARNRLGKGWNQYPSSSSVHS